MALYATDQLLSIADEEAKKAGLDPKVVRAIVLSENGGKRQIDTETTSPVGAYGIMQVKPSTAANLVRMGYSTGDQSTPQGQIQLGVAALKEMYDRGIIKPAEQAVAYNGGTRALDDFRNGRTMNPETTGYLQRFSQHMGGDMADTTDASPGTTTSTREGYSVSQRNIDPATKARIDTQLQESTALSADTIQRVKALSQGITSNADTASAAIDAASRAKGEEIAAEARTKTATIDDRESILNAFGISLNNPENIIAKRMETIRSNNNERAQLSNQIGALDSGASPLTDPVGWLVNAVKQYPLVQRHNALVQESNAAAKEIEIAQGLASNQEKIQPAAIKDAINNEALAKANALVAEGSVQKAQLQGVAMARVAQLAIDMDHVSGSSVARNIQWADATSSHTSTNYSTTEKNKEETDFFAGINSAAAAWGFPPTWNKVTFKALDKPTQDLWVKMSQFGRTGVSPGEAVSLLYGSYGGAGLAKMNENAPIAGKFMQDIVKNGQTTLDALQVKAMADPKVANQLKNLKDPMAQLAYGIDTWFKSKEDELKNKDMSRVSTDNPYKLQPAYVATTAELKDNPLSKLITEKKVTGIKIDDQLLLSSALADVTTGKRTVGDVAQYVQEFYKKGSDIQRRDSAATLAGIKALDNYPAILTLRTLSGKPVDLFSRESIEQFLVLNGAADKAANTQGFGETPFGFR